MSFDSLGLNPEILRAVAEQGYREPTPIQQQAIPAVLEGRDLMASAQTGTGKTAGFTLPLLQHLITNQPHGKSRRPVRALILTPTRELAAQIGENVRDYSKYLNIRSLVVFGGVSINPQMMKLRGGVDVLIATPGRLLDLEHQNAVKLDQVEILVLDEADRMLDMGFIHDIRRVLAKLPAKRQNLLFSATFSNDITALAGKLLLPWASLSVVGLLALLGLTLGRGWHPAGSLVWVAVALVLFLALSVAMGAFLAALTRSLRTALSGTGFITAPAFAFGGVGFPLVAMPAAARAWAAAKSSVPS